MGWFVDPKIPATLLIDATRVQQILLNLLSNALKVSNARSHADRHWKPTALRAGPFLTHFYSPLR